MKKLYLRIIAIFLVVVMTAAPLVSCNKPQSEENTYSRLAEQGKIYNLAGIKNNIADYVIVRSDSSNKNITETAVYIRNILLDVLSVDLKLTTDWDGSEDNSERLEILVGKTNREASINAVSSLEEGEYVITEDDRGNIIIAGYDDKMTETAAEVFLMQYFGYEEVNMMNHNVRDYGAVGDGITDDTKAFRDAVSAAGKDGLPVYVPGGNYKITDTITLSSVTLYGYETAAWTADTCDQPLIEQANMEKPLFFQKK